MSFLSNREIALLDSARRAVLATTAADGSPRLVPVALVHIDGLLYTPLDQKPKSVADPRDLARVHDIEARPRVWLVVDRWDEDWTKLAWLRLAGTARLIEPDGEDAAEHELAVRLLRAKYLQYEAHALESRPVIRIELGHAKSWFAS